MRRSRAGEPKRLVTPKSAMAVKRFGAVDLSGPCRVHVGDNRRHAEGREKQCEQRKRAEVDFARLNVVGVPQCFDLGGEVAVRVDGPLGHAGAAAGEQDGGRLSACTTAGPGDLPCCRMSP